MTARPTDRRHVWARQVLAREALRTVVARCDQAGIAVLPVKGVLTSVELYDDPTERTFADVDLRVRPRDLEAVRRLASQAGWRVVEESRAYAMVSYEVGHTLVELEAHVGPPGLCGLTVEALLSRAERRVEPLGFPHLAPELHDHCLLTCVNVFKDKLTDTPPASLGDLERFARAPAFRVPTLAARAREVGAATLVWAVATWMAERRGQARWREVAAALEPRRVRRRYARLYLRHVDRPSSLATRLLMRFASDRPRDWLVAAGALLARPLEQRPPARTARP